MNKISNNQKNLLIILVVLLVLVFGYIIYKSYQVTSSHSSVSNTFDIPQLGIKIVNIPNSISDLTDAEMPFSPSMAVDKNNTLNKPVQMISFSFSTKKLTSDSSSCSAKNDDGIGFIERINGTYVDRHNNTGYTFVKQFNGFYIVLPNRGGGVCSNVKSILNLDHSQSVIFNKTVLNPLNIQLL